MHAKERKLCLFPNVTLWATKIYTLYFTWLIINLILLCYTIYTIIRTSLNILIYTSTLWSKWQPNIIGFVFNWFHYFTRVLVLIIVLSYYRETSEHVAQYSILPYFLYFLHSYTFYTSILLYFYALLSPRANHRDSPYSIVIDGYSAMFYIAPATGR